MAGRPDFDTCEPKTAWLNTTRENHDLRLRRHCRDTDGGHLHPARNLQLARLGSELPPQGDAQDRRDPRHQSGAA